MGRRLDRPVLVSEEWGVGSVEWGVGHREWGVGRYRRKCMSCIKGSGGGGGTNGEQGSRVERSVLFREMHKVDGEG